MFEEIYEICHVMTLCVGRVHKVIADKGGVSPNDCELEVIINVDGEDNLEQQNREVAEIRMVQHVFVFKPESPNIHRLVILFAFTHPHHKICLWLRIYACVTHSLAGPGAKGLQTSAMICHVV